MRNISIATWVTYESPEYAVYIPNEAAEPELLFSASRGVGANPEFPSEPKLWLVLIYSCLALVTKKNDRLHG